MGDGLIPLPLLRMPCFYKDRHARFPSWGDYLGHLTQYDEVEMQKKVILKSKPLGLLQLFFVIGGAICFGVYQLLYFKGYLEDVDIVANSRINLQHPTKGHCNPLDTNCEPDFKLFKDLPYCQGQNHEILSGGVSERRHIDCAYYNVFDILKFQHGNDASKFLIPTRISKIRQIRNKQCGDDDAKCDRWINDPKSAPQDHYVADVESFTLRLDHSYSCPEVTYLQDKTLKGDTFTSQGYERSCPGEGEDSCVLKYISCKKCLVNMQNASTFERLNSQYGVHNEAEYWIGTALGDIISIEHLLKLARADLDKQTAFSRHVREKAHARETPREEGMTIIIDVVYVNHHVWSRPSRLPPVYIYNVEMAPAETMKMSSVEQENEVTRTIIDAHGIYIVTRVRSRIGEATLQNIFLVMLEGFTIIGTASWLVSCLAVNYRPCTSEGDDFAESLHDNLDATKIGIDDDLLAHSVKGVFRLEQQSESDDETTKHSDSSFA
eukprot:TRINITY_DN18101_c0_g1_i1.p1 TRINITY_DN18101_c0_g1~~TRINITY_DN18101_c0_g1_i1.p1  ORF type:complete len:493 (+),score=64.60 TRINITY_DN18101_c0_g1_i1:33-1511(+)